ncbi:hypothetical protein AMK68_00475 [candidate division KD3-62 bacterium DG_56]|uniref:Uncharacterized protein n=1 Tax=candidate division KD3-62 bacterium DG_56 TaxID=1704032 RepID=A0A0S7XSB7_9BACT|nr:MAG: hypothetical protein AMK68_00475 [candidate division KD3-62 bacterium DG_56]
MRTGHTGLKVITAVAICVSGCLLLWQVQGNGTGVLLRVPGHWAAAVSLILVAAAAVSWARPLRAHLALTAVLGMLGTQFVLLLATGVALEAVQPKAPGAQLVAPLTDGLSVLIAALLAVGAWTPLRGLLGDERSRRRAQAMRARRATLSRRDLPVPQKPETEEQGFVLGVAEADSQAVSDRSRGTQTGSGGEPRAGEAAAPADLAADGDVEVPALVIFKQLHQVGAIDQSVVARVPSDLAVSIPIALVAPGLREGAVVLPISALAPYLPDHLERDGLVAEPDEMTTEPMIMLPLEIVVPQIPKEAFVLPAMPSPEWMSLEREEEHSSLESTLSLVQESDSDGLS